VAEKLRRHWMAMDCGKLGIYTTQQRLFSHTTTIGAAKKDNRFEPERVEDWAEHLQNLPGVLLISEKARRGECEVTLDLLHDLAALAKKHDLIKKVAALPLVCPEATLRTPESQLQEPEDGPGAKGERFYVIAPVVAMAFAEDEVRQGETTYVFLKVPLSVLLRLIECEEPAALKQPTKEEDVNEVIDAVGFDFISQPQVRSGR
jgi:site-specific DNA-methyltransferase (adenine-specific)/adenine-specific DNA-methyltransferase